MRHQRTMVTVIVSFKAAYTHKITSCHRFWPQTSSDTYTQNYLRLRNLLWFADVFLNSILCTWMHSIHKAYSSYFKTSPVHKYLRQNGLRNCNGICLGLNPTNVAWAQLTDWAPVGIRWAWSSSHIWSFKAELV